MVAKRSDVSHHHHQDANGIGHTSSSTTYYATFQVASGDRMELCVGGSEYGMLAEGISVISASRAPGTWGLSGEPEGIVKRREAPASLRFCYVSVRKWKGALVDFGGGIG